MRDLPPEPVHVLTIRAPRASMPRPWSINESHLHRTQARLRKEWRDQGYWLACEQIGRTRAARALPPTEVLVSIPFATHRRRDPHNYTGTVVKALIDGLRDAGCWPDDTAEYVRVADPILTVGGSLVIRLDRMGPRPHLATTDLYDHQTEEPDPA